MTRDMIRIKTGISAGWIAGSAREDVVEAPRAQWEAMTGGEREAYLDELAESQLGNNVETWAYVMEDGD